MSATIAPPLSPALAATQFGPVASVRVTPFRELTTVSRTTLIGAVSMYGVSALNDDTSATTGEGASVAESGGELVLTTGTAGAGVASLVTNRRVVYAPGHVAEVGMGIRIPTAPTGSQVARWGCFDAGNGYGFGVDATGLFSFIRRAGSDTITRATAWPSRPTIDLAAGHIFQILFTWYGYGTIRWETLVDTASERTSATVYQHTPSGQSSIVDPNQPITIEARNGGTESSLAVYVGGRSLQVLGDRPQARRTGVVLRQNMSVGSTTPAVAIALRKKSTFRDRANSVNVAIEGVTVAALSNAVLYRVLRASSAAEGSWGAPANIAAAETAVEVNLTATGFTGGVLIAAGYAAAASSGARLGAAAEEAIRSVIGSGETVVLTVEQTAGGGAGTAWMALDWSEEW